MSPLPVIEDVFRCTVNFAQVDGVQPVNVFHVYANGRTVEQVAEGIDEACGSYPLMNGMDIAFQPQTISILPLDGESATGIYDLSEGSWATESAPGDWSPATAAVVTLRTGQRGPRGRGRLYIGPLVEASSADGHLVGETADVLATAWQDFRDDMEALIPQMILVVASYVHADGNPVTSINVSEIVGTQRRRQDQLR